ncbi:hypothetical protein VPH35_028376 [Triticum aestivum]
MYGASNMVDRLHPESVRVYRITSELVRAIHRGLTIKSLKQGGSPEAARRHTAHLEGLDWDVILVRDRELSCTLGALDLLKTDEEIASIIAHEAGARGRSHWNPTARRCWLRSTRSPATIETIKEKLGSRKACATHPSTEARLQLLSQHKVMEEALQLYREVKANYSLCLTLRSMAASPEYGRFLLGE